ncbi:MAG: hypothetical protein ACI4LO_08580 [Anaerovoracaceae bacterium]
MDSFGIWYKLKNDEKPSIDLHINLWNIPKAEYKRNIDTTEPFIDFGLKIKGFRRVEELIISFPFELFEDEFEDLYEKVSKRNIARAIFNDSTIECSTCAEYMYLEMKDEKQKTLLINLAKRNSFAKGFSMEKSQEGDEKYTLFKLDFREIKNDRCYDEYDDIYLRFRIRSKKLKEMLFCRLQTVNWLLLSDFSTTQIIDFKVNKERNLSADLCRHLAKKGFDFSEFDKIHFLVMNQATEQISILSNHFEECRKLEEKDWDEYLSGKYKTDEVLVYHFKDKKKENCKKEFSGLLKITAVKVNWKRIFAYIVAVLLIGSVGSLIPSLIVKIFG